MLVKVDRCRFPTLMTTVVTTALSLIVICSMAAPAHALKVMFGTRDYLVTIQDVDIKGPAGETLYLGHKYAHHSFIAPYMLSDDGYILGVVGQNRYFKLDASLIEQFQASGKLPKPLPPYEISIIDYLFGYMLWLIIAGIAVAGYFSSRKAARAKEALPFAHAGLAHEQAGQLDRLCSALKLVHREGVIRHAGGSGGQSGISRSYRAVG